MKKFSIIFFILLSIINSSSAKTTITLWHAMSGHLGVVLNNIVQQFNNSQNNYYLEAVYKGNYSTTLTSTVAAFRAGKQPDMVQVFEVGTQLMIKPKGVIYPVYELMKKYGGEVSLDQFIPAIGEYYADEQNHLLGLPFNSSSPVLYVNVDELAKAGITPEDYPKTWPQLAEVAQQLVDKGNACGFTTAWPSWIQLESFSAWHNIPYASDNNGFASLDAKLLFDNPLIETQISSLMQWQKNHLFVYGGREDNAESLFTSGKCAMMFETSGILGSLKKSVSFKLAVLPLPYWPTVEGAPQNTIIGGAAIWVLQDHDDKTYQAVTAFLDFLTEPQIEAYWQQQTGYLPVTKAAFELSQKQGFYQQNPGAMVAMQELMNKPPTAFSKGIRLGYMPQIRNINNNMLEEIFTGQISVKEGLQQAENKGNRLISRFKRSVTNAETKRNI